MWLGGSLALPGLVLFLAGCGQPTEADRPERPRDVTSFTSLFAQHCQGCHGTKGKNGAAPPLNDPLFLAVASHDELTRTIGDGRPGTLMPPFTESKGGPLTEKQAEVLAQGIHKWGRTDDELKEYAAVLQATAAGDAQAGAKVYERACAECHGPNGRGGSKGDLNDPSFLALMSNQALRRIAFTGRPDLGMPDYRGKDGRPADFQPLSSKDIADLGALFTTWKTEKIAQR